MRTALKSTKGLGKCRGMRKLVVTRQTPMRTVRGEQNFETSQLDIAGVAQLLSDEMKRSAN